MTPEERTLLSDLFQHLREVESQPRDPEAESFIRQSVQSQPLAAYYMAQTVLVQQQALTAAQTRIEDLERQVREAQSRTTQPAAPAAGGSFLSNALGLGRSPWGSRGGDARPAPQPQQGRSPWGGPQQGGFGQQPGYPQQQGFGQRGGGGFLAGAAQTAAGVAGGMLAASAISSMLSHSPGPFGEAAASTASAPAADAAAAPEAREVSHQEDAGYQADDASFDGGGDSGGDDSWI